MSLSFSELQSRHRPVLEQALEAFSPGQLPTEPWIFEPPVLDLH